MKLWQITFKVRPAVEHPLYWDWGAGFLNLWLFASSDDDAVARATAIIEQLPYETVGDEASFRDRDTNPSSDSEPDFKKMEEIARRVGFAHQLIGVAVGANEGDFETMETP